MISENALLAVVERAFLMVELHLSIKFDPEVDNMHHDNVSLRLHFGHRPKAILTRFQTAKRIRRICTHLVLRK